MSFVNIKQLKTLQSFFLLINANFLEFQKMMCTTSFQIKPDQGIQSQLQRRNGIASQNTYRIPSQQKKQSQRINPQVYDRFQIFSLVQSFKNIRNMFLSLYGRHSAINYKKNYRFKQQWQASDSFKDIETEKSQSSYAFYAFFFVLLAGVTLWGLSMCLLFEDIHKNWSFSLMLVLDLIQIFHLSKRYKFSGMNFKKWIKKISKQLFCLLFGLARLSISSISQIRIIWKLLTLLVMFYFYKKLSKRYQQLKIFHIPSVYQDKINLIDLFIFLITISHIFAIALGGITQTNPQKNWMHKVDGLYDDDWQTKYIYSFYFACTTLLTVGYGDLSPTNPKQIMVVLVIEIIGIATFGYTVNQIGTVIANMQSRQQKMEKDLNCIENLGNNYRLEPQIVCRMRSELLYNMEISKNLKLQEENQILNSFSDNLRDQIQTESGLKLLKRSLFAITNWTGKLQFKIAQKLIKQIYSPQQFLLMPSGKQKLYIIDEGKVDIVNDRNEDSKSNFRKKIKTIDVKKNQQIVLENVFGYSSMISSRKINLNAKCKSICICYTLNKDNFSNILSDCAEDKEYFHELKDKINLAKIPEQIEVPSIINIRQHYQPIPMFIYAKYRALQEKIKNKRKSYRRNSRKSKIKIKNQDQSNPLLKTILKKQWLMEIIGDNNEQQQKICEQPVEFFQAAKEYTRYFCKRNYNNLIKKMKSKNYIGNKKL